MSELKVVYSEYAIEPILEGSKLTMPDRSNNLTWGHISTKCNDVHIVAKFDRENMLPSGEAPFLKWIFYAQTDGVWVEAEWNNLTEKHKMAVFNKIVTQHGWMPFYEQDVLPPWEDAWFTLAALGQS